MKKLLSVILAMVIAMSFFTGCVDSEPAANPDPTPAPTPTPEVVADPVDTEDPNYATVLAMWEDMDGYWVDEDGDYLMFKLDDSGKAELFVYDDGKLERQMKTTAVMASNKTSYYMAFSGVNSGLFIELEGYGDGYVKIAEEDDDDMDYEVFVYVGENLDKLQDAIKTAEKLEKD